jgi:hypothetical protein
MSRVLGAVSFEDASTRLSDENQGFPEILISGGYTGWLSPALADAGEKGRARGSLGLLAPPPAGGEGGGLPGRRGGEQRVAATQRLQALPGQTGSLPASRWKSPGASRTRARRR